MKHYFRYLSLLVLTFWNTQTFAIDEIDRFAKRCDFYTEAEYGTKSLIEIRKNRNTLRLAKVPIQMSFADCEAIKYVVKLPNGSSVSLESAYPTNSDPEVKGSRYAWDANSPSSKYWYFTYGGWEDVGWMLIDKVTGRKIESKTECFAPEISIRKNLMALICTGTYENRSATIYIVNTAKDETVWSKPIAIQNCKHPDEYLNMNYFVAKKFDFINSTTLRVEGDCSMTESSGEKWFKVKQLVTISHDSLKSISNGVITKFDWVIGY